MDSTHSQGKLGVGVAVLVCVVVGVAVLVGVAVFVCVVVGVGVFVCVVVGVGVIWLKITFTQGQAVETDVIVNPVMFGPGE
jgi:hypothetical protein